MLTLEEKSCRISWCDLWKRFFFRVWESFSIFWFGWWYHSTRTKGLLAFLEECFEICHRWETFFRWSGSSLLGSRFNVSLLLIPYPPTSNRDAKSLFLDDKSAWKISLSRVETSTTSILLPSPFSAPLQYSTKLECVVFFSFRCQPFLLMRLRSHFRFLPDFLFSNLHANLNTYFQGRVLIIPFYDVVLYTPKSPSQTHKLHDSLSIKIESSRLQDLTHKLCAAPLPKLIFKRHLKFWLHWNLFRQANVKLTVRDYASLAWIYSCLFVRLF